jgi:hypothetical protein
VHQLNSTKRARVTSNAIHLPGSRILHYVRFRYPIRSRFADPNSFPRKTLEKIIRMGRVTLVF